MGFVSLNKGRVKSSAFGFVILISMFFAATDLRAGGYSYKDDTSFGLAIGGFALIKPKYEGSEDYEVIGFPYLFPLLGEGDGPLSGLARRVKVRGADDIRFRLFDWNGFEAGPLGGYNFGRDQDDSPRLNGLGDIDDGIVLGGYAGYRIDALLFDISYHDQVTGDDDTGFQLRFGVEVERPVSEALTLTGRVGATYADDDYMSTYFGVTAAQSAASGLPAFSASDGIKDVHVELGAKVKLTENWTFRAKGTYARLLGDAADSPVIETEDQFYASLGLIYKLRWGR